MGAEGTKEWFPSTVGAIMNKNRNQVRLSCAPKRSGILPTYQIERPWGGKWVRMKMFIDCVRRMHYPSGCYHFCQRLREWETQPETQVLLEPGSRLMDFKLDRRTLCWKTHLKSCAPPLLRRCTFTRTHIKVEATNQLLHLSLTSSITAHVYS